MSANILLALTDAELRAGHRVLVAMTNHGHPVVSRYVAEALGDLPRADLWKFIDHLYGALLSQTPEEAVG